ncbi:MAG: Trk system potassium transporter TrkA [Clostridia bacterium]|nr:Trk system potassium transporter TrkA [Clostridia bacterium]
MKILVVGCGKVGLAIIEALVREQHEVLAIDQNAEVATRVANTYDVMSVCGNGSAVEVLSGAGVEQADLVVATTKSDELNMLTCFVAKKMGAKNTIARIRSGEYNTSSLDFLKKNLGINMTINPEKLTADAFFNVLSLPSASKVEKFSDGNFELFEFLVKDEENLLADLTLAQIKAKVDASFLICAIERDGKVIIPNGNSQIKEGDRVSVMATRKDAQKMLKSLGLTSRRSRSAIVVGAGETALYLTQRLVENRVSVKVVEKDRDRCEKASEILPSAVTVVCGDGTDSDIMLEEGVGKADAVVALAGKDEENVLIAYNALLKKTKKVIAKINRYSIMDMTEDLGIESAICPLRLVADVVVRHARAIESGNLGAMETLYSIMDGEAEAIEFEVPDDFKYIGQQLKSMKLKQSVLIGAILRQSEAIIPGGDDTIMAGDRVIVISKGHRLLELGDIIR